MFFDVIFFHFLFQSCTKAYDLYGYIAEKEQNYKDAVKNYEKAWQLTSKSNPVIGMHVLNYFQFTFMGYTQLI